MTEDSSTIEKEAGTVRRDLPDAAATTAMAQALAPVLARGDAVFLEGPLGAGKTHFARAVIQARLAELGLYEDVPSPTFTLVQTYPTDPPIWHADLYRLSDVEEVYELGLDEGLAEGVALIEWPDRLGHAAPQRRLELAFAHDGPGRAVAARFEGRGWDAARAALSA